MTQLTIVTTPPNSGDGTPLATAFNYCNSNFSELYARYQVSPPVSLTGTAGDVAGMYASDSNYFYYCFADYDGSSTIWAQITQIGNVSVSSITNGTSNVKIADINGNVTTSIGGTSNITTVSATGQYVSGVISASGNIQGNYILGNGSQLTGLPQSYGNSNVAAYLPTYTGNIGAGNISVVSAVSAATVTTTGNIAGGNITTSGQISATGNIVTDQYFVGNFFGNITGNFTIPGSNTQVVFNTNGNADAVAGFTFDTTGPNLLTVLGTVSAVSNVQAGNLVTAGLISAAGNITAGNISVTGISGSLLTAVQTNITSIGTLTSLSVTSNIQGGNLRTAGSISAAGNIVAGNISTTDIAAGGNISATRYTGTSISVAGNIIGGNLYTNGTISAAGNITGNYIFGNGSQLSGIDASAIQNGNSNVRISGANANVVISVAGVSPLTIFANTGAYITGVVDATSNISGGNILTNGQMSATSNISGGNILTNGQMSATSNISGGNILTNGQVSVFGTITSGDILTGGAVSATGNITGNNLSVGTGTVTLGNIVNANANGVGNIGSASTYFNTVFAQATSAQYADLAEIYAADAEYVAGTVVIFGGDQEITVTSEYADERVAGAISTNPAYLMNSGADGAAVALRGRVPVRVVGAVTKGDGLVTANIPGVACSVGRSRDYAQAVFAKALETSTDIDEKIIQAVIL